jgi:hypothetical protein
MRFYAWICLLMARNLEVTHRVDGAVRDVDGTVKATKVLTEGIDDNVKAAKVLIENIEDNVNVEGVMRGVDNNRKVNTHGMQQLFSILTHIQTLLPIMAIKNDMLTGNHLQEGQRGGLSKATHSRTGRRTALYYGSVEIYASVALSFLCQSIILRFHSGCRTKCFMVRRLPVSVIGY